MQQQKEHSLSHDEHDVDDEDEQHNESASQEDEEEQQSDENEEEEEEDDEDEDDKFETQQQNQDVNDEDEENEIEGDDNNKNEKESENEEEEEDDEEDDDEETEQTAKRKKRNKRRKVNDEDEESGENDEEEEEEEGDDDEEEEEEEEEDAAADQQEITLKIKEDQNQVKLEEKQLSSNIQKGEGEKQIEVLEKEYVKISDKEESKVLSQSQYQKKQQQNQPPIPIKEKKIKKDHQVIEQLPNNLEDARKQVDKTAIVEKVEQKQVQQQNKQQDDQKESEHLKPEIQNNQEIKQALEVEQKIQVNQIAENKEQIQESKSPKVKEEKQKEQDNEKEEEKEEQDEEEEEKQENKEEEEQGVEEEKKEENTEDKIEEVKKEKKPEVRPQIIYNPLEDVDSYPGQYTDSGESEEETSANANDSEADEDEESERAVSGKKQANQGKKKGGKKDEKQQVKKVQVKRKKQTLVLNVADTKYCVVRFVGKKIFKWKLQYQMEAIDWDICWTDNAVQPEQLGRMQPYQKINHFPGMFSLARKNHLARNLMKMRKCFPKEYGFFPQTWLLPAEYNDFRNHIERARAPHNTFIAKPEASCQGRGIFLTKTLDDFNQNDHYVVQKYLHNPYLIDGLKFDFRLYVLLAGCDPLRIYLYYEGLTRFATEPYKDPSRDNLENMCVHLTNYAINKDNPNFEFNSDQTKMDVGHKRSLTSVLQLLEEKGHDVNNLWKDIKRVLIKTIISAQPTLAHHYRSCQPDNFANNMCFELLGFDIIIDSKLKPWLLEVNHTPSFVTDTPLDGFIKKNAIRDSLRLMNASCKAKNEIMNSRKEIMQKRVLTGKKVKYTPEEKTEEIKKAQIKRDTYEDSHLGGFERIFPIDDDEEDKFGEYTQHALKCYEESTGANIRRNQKKITEDPKKITNLPQSKLNNPKDLEKIYNSKQQKPLPPKKAIGPPRCAPGYHQPPYPQRSDQLDPNADEGVRGEDDISDQTGQVSRSASGKIHDFRIKKSPYGINNKLKNKMQNRVAIGMKELRLGEELTQFDDPLQIGGAKNANLNQKKIQAYMLISEPQSKPPVDKSKKFSEDKIYMQQPLQPLQMQQLQLQPSLQVQSLQVNSEYPLKRPQLPQPPIQKQMTSNKIPFSIIDNGQQLDEERRQWLANAQRNLQYQLSQQQYQPQQSQQQQQQQQRLSLLKQLPNQYSSDISNSKDILAAVGGTISGQYKPERRTFYKQKSGAKEAPISNSFKDERTYLQSKMFDMTINNSNSNNGSGRDQTASSLTTDNIMNTINNDLFVSGKTHKVPNHFNDGMFPMNSGKNGSSNSNNNQLFYPKQL